MCYEESIIQKDLSTIMTIVEINKSAIIEKENTIIFEWSNFVKYNLIWLLYEFSIYFWPQGLGLWTMRKNIIDEK